MSKPSHHFAFAALILWLLASWGGAYGHLCFDGKEPPISVHLQLLHMDEAGHHPDEVHQDLDVELLNSAVAKNGKTDIGPIIFAALLLILCFHPQRIFAGTHVSLLLSSPLHERPPLRAPPFTA